MTRLITTVRHAATANAGHQVISGTLDEPLSDEGRAQARELVTKLGWLRADAVVSSPLSRAFETACLLTGCEASQIERWGDCIERDYGVLQGLPPAEVAKWRPSIRYIRAGGIDHSDNPPQGETLSQVRSRARRVAAALYARPEASILVFSHQTFIQQLHGVLLGVSQEQALAIDVAVLQIDEFEVSDGAVVSQRTLHPGERAIRSW